MSYLNNGRGTLVLDKRIKGLGRLKKSTGTSDPSTFKKIQGMVETLKDSGRIDILRNVMNGGVTLLEVWEHYRESKLEKIPTVNSIKSLEPMVLRWVESYDISDRTRKVYRNNIRQLLKLGNRDCTVQDLPDLLKKYRAQCQKKGFNRPFNHTRSTFQSFVNNELGRYSDLWFKVSEVKPLPTTKKRKGNPQSVKSIKTLVDELPRKYGDMVWTLCTTGMGFTDYKGQWSVHKDHVFIEGTKNENRVRKIPRIGTPTRPTTTEQYLRKALKSVTKKDIQIYDFRRTYSHWMEMSEIPRSRRQSYMGHSSRDILGNYESHEVEEYLRLDGKRLNDYIEKETGSRPRIR